MEKSGQLHAPAVLPRRERAPGTQWIEDWVGPRAGMDEAKAKKVSSIPLPGMEPRSSRP